MNKRINELAQKAEDYADDAMKDASWLAIYTEKLAELLIEEFVTLLFDESQRLYEYSSECDNMRESDEAEVVAEKCVDLIAAIEEHFGVK